MVTGMQQFKNGVWNTIDIRGARKLTINDNITLIFQEAHLELYTWLQARMLQVMIQ